MFSLNLESKFHVLNCNPDNSVRVEDILAQQEEIFPVKLTN